MNLSTACSVALNSTTLFASSHFISPRYEEAEKEAEHHLLQKRGYYNYIDDVEISRPIFDLGPEATVALVNRLWDANYQDLALGGWSLLDIRTHASMFERAGMAVRHVGDLERKYILAYAFYSDAPLIPIPKEEIAMYRNGIPRSKIGSVLNHIPQTVRQKVLQIIAHLEQRVRIATSDEESDWARIASYLCHSYNAAEVIRDIARKWNYDRDCPLPVGVERHPGTSRLVWKKTGEAFTGHV
ncbi:hypothetical protein M408DRAFT_30299 [Serendipita vermifera MAFF 305830]|uniref:Uncharacterized protein n=1 Tax=Serendipita vermifera MAFF 305830 TaxID=933852 RepID=A0A0C3AMK4_SERVB|nr:hypothetical protein M408DRAFT_30299 [Serendipita vermifera MAFF 305830]